LSAAFFHLWKRACISPSEGCMTSSLVTGIRHSAVPYHLHNGNVAGCLSKNNRCKSDGACCQDHWVGMSTLSVQILWWPEWCTHPHVVNSDHYIGMLRSSNNFLWYVPQEKCMICCSSMTLLGQIQICTPLRQSQSLDGQCSFLCPTVLTLHLWIFTCMVLWKIASEDIVIQMVRHCRTSCASGCGRSRATFAGQDYVLLFNNGWWLLKTDGDNIEK
jgi:hypothetical protein